MRYITDFWTAAKLPRLDIDEAVDDLLAIAIAQMFRERLAEQQRAEASSSHEDAEKRKPRGKKVDHLYCRQTPTEFIACIKSLTPRQKEAVNELDWSYG